MKRRLALLLAAATTISLMGCATSNQKAAETTPAAQTQEAKAETEKAETTEEAKEAESEKAEPETGGYAVQPRSIKDRTLKVGLIPVSSFSIKPCRYGKNNVFTRFFHVFKHHFLCLSRRNIL